MTAALLTQHPALSRLRSSGCVGVAAIGLAFPLLLAAQESPSVRLQGEEWIVRTRPIELRLSRALNRQLERIVVFVGTRDLSPQSSLSADGLTLRASPPRSLQPGSHEIVVWLVRDDSVWTELARHAVRVEGAFGTRERKATTTGQIGVTSRFRTDADPVPTDRSAFNDVAGNAAVDLSASWRETRAGLRVNLVGTSYRPAALRYSERAGQAPLVDLPSFVASVGRGSSELAIGQLSTGNHRYLLNGFSSRGSSIRFARSRLELSAATLAASNIVGWDDLLGATEPDHRIVNGQIAVEALPTSGVLRVELSALDAAARPVTGFTQGAVVDAEQSKGMGVRVRSTTFGQRLRLDAGLARSRFDVRPDRQLGSIDSLVPVERETRQARYAELSADLLRAHRLWKDRTMSLFVGASHERVDPLFRSVGTFVQSDRSQRRLDVRGDVSGLRFDISHGRGRDNLARIPSLLETQSQRTNFDLSAPLGAVIGATNARWLPTIGARGSRTLQQGAGIPVGGGFDASHIPDQLSLDHTFSASWQIDRGTFAVQHNSSEQDNRQPGRERADLRNATWSGQLALTVHRHISLSGDWGRSNSHAIERDERERQRRWGMNVNLLQSAPVSLALQLSGSSQRSVQSNHSRDDSQLGLHLAAVLPKPLASAGRWFIRYTSQRQTTRATESHVRQSRSTLDGGLTLSLR